MKQSVFFLVLGLALCAGLTVGAQDPNYVLSHAGTSGAIGQGAAGTQATLDQILDANGAEALAGWSWGCCHVGTADILSVADGTTTMTVNGGMPPAFNAPAILPGQGWTIGVVINFFGDNPLQPGTGYHLHTATYGLAVADPQDESITQVTYCNTLGDPLVMTTLVDSAGGSINPTVVEGGVQGVIAQCFSLTAGSQTVQYPDGAASQDFVNNVFLNELDEDPTCGGSLTQGFSIGLSHDGAVLTATDVVLDPAVPALIGQDPDFFGPNIDPMPGPGVTVGVVFAFLGGVFGDFTGMLPGVPVIDISYSADVSGGGIIVTGLQFIDTLGTPPVVNTVVVDGGSVGVTFITGSITLEPVTEEPFVRGDCNNDQIVNIADGIWMLSELFSGGPASTCPEACDANGDGSYDQSDAVYVFNWRFLGGPPPAAPFPDCGTQDGITPDVCETDC